MAPRGSMRPQQSGPGPLSALRKLASHKKDEPTRNDHPKNPAISVSKAAPPHSIALPIQKRPVPPAQYARSGCEKQRNQHPNINYEGTTRYPPQAPPAHEYKYAAPQAIWEGPRSGRYLDSNEYMEEEPSWPPSSYYRQYDNPRVYQPPPIQPPRRVVCHDFPDNTPARNHAYMIPEIGILAPHAAVYRNAPAPPVPAHTPDWRRTRHAPQNWDELLPETRPVLLPRRNDPLPALNIPSTRDLRSRRISLNPEQLSTVSLPRKADEDFELEREVLERQMRIWSVRFASKMTEIYGSDSPPNSPLKGGNLDNNIPSVHELDYDSFYSPSDSSSGSSTPSRMSPIYWHRSGSDSTLASAIVEAKPRRASRASPVDRITFKAAVTNHIEESQPLPKAKVANGSRSQNAGVEFTRTIKPKKSIILNDSPFGAQLSQPSEVSVKFAESTKHEANPAEVLFSPAVDEEFLTSLVLSDPALKPPAGEKLHEAEGYWAMLEGEVRKELDMQEVIVQLRALKAAI